MFYRIDTIILNVLSGQRYALYTKVEHSSNANI